MLCCYENDDNDDSDDNDYNNDDNNLRCQLSGKPKEGMFLPFRKGALAGLRGPLNTDPWIRSLMPYQLGLRVSCPTHFMFACWWLIVLMSADRQTDRKIDRLID